MKRIMLALRNQGEPIRRSQGGFLSRSFPPSEADSIQNYTVQQGSCLMSEDCGVPIWVSKEGSGKFGSTK